MSTISNYYYSPSTITNLLRKAVDTVEADCYAYKIMSKYEYC